MKKSIVGLSVRVSHTGQYMIGFQRRIKNLRKTGTGRNIALWDVQTAHYGDFEQWHNINQRPITPASIARFNRVLSHYRQSKKIIINNGVPGKIGSSVYYYVKGEK